MDDFQHALSSKAFPHEWPFRNPEFRSAAAECGLRAEATNVPAF